MDVSNNKFLVKSYFRISVWLLPITLAIFLAVVSFYNGLLFHTLAELFAITIAILMCVVAWNMYPFTRNNYLMYLGAGYFWIAILDLTHTLHYTGMNIFADGGSNTAVQFWIGTRYLEAILLVSAPFFLNHSFNRNNGFIFFGLGTAGIIILVKTGLFPEGFIEGKGLTPFKIYSEYIVIALLAAAIYYLIKQKSLLESSIVNAMVVSIILTMGAELAFTFYVSVFGLSNIVGHLFKLFSFWLIFLAVIRTTLTEPFLTMSRGSSTYDAVPDATIVVDENGIIRQANIQAHNLVKHEISNLVGKNNHELFHPYTLEVEHCPVCQAIFNNEELIGLELKFDKEERWFDYSLSHIKGVSGLDGTVEVIRDITERKATKVKVKELGVLKNSIVENLPSMIFVKDAKDFRFVEWNKAAEEITGLSKEDILGKNDFDFWPKEQAQKFVDKDNEVIKAGESIEIERETLTTKQKGTRTLHTKKIPIYDENGGAKYLLGISEDITDKLKTEEMLSRSQKMDAVGQMSGGIAHDFNNQLGVILGYVELLSGQDLSEMHTKWLAMVQDAAQRCADLTQQLLIFSRNGEVDKEITNVNMLISEMEIMIERSLTPEVKVNYILSDDIWNIDVNTGGFKDAILNLVLNARDAMPDGGELIIETTNITLDESNASVFTSIPKGEYIEVMVSDTGYGMSEVVYEHVFEPFFTTKDVGSGTGLGLAMVYGFVHRYNGDISLETEQGKGTTFRIYLPKARTSNLNTPVSNDDDKKMVLGSESILIVDDEEALLKYAEQVLKTLGYKVYSASNVTAALSILENNAIDLLFTDVVMPGGTNGYELAEKACKENSQLKVLMTSGFAEKSSDNNKYAKYGFELLTKPYDLARLAEKLRYVIDK